MRKFCSLAPVLEFLKPTIDRYHVKPLLLILPVLFNVACNSVFYQPDDIVRGYPSDIGLAYQEFDLELFEDENINGWVVSPDNASGEGSNNDQVKNPDSEVTLVHFHGNAQNMTAHYSFVSWLAQFGYEVIVFDYRGYGKSKGRATRQGTVSDGILVLKYVTEQLKRKNVFVLGQSLGGAVSVAALGEFRHPSVKGLILESTFESYRALAQDKISGLWPFWLFQVPLSYLVTDEFAPRNYAQSLADVPILFLHGLADPVVPHWHGKALFRVLENAANAQVLRQLELLPGAGHTSAFYEEESLYRTMLVDFMQKFARD